MSDLLVLCGNKEKWITEEKSTATTEYPDLWLTFLESVLSVLSLMNYNENHFAGMGASFS